MAKLVIALCMLIVACSAGKLDSMLGNAEQVIVDKITEYREKIDEAVKQVQEYWNTAIEEGKKSIEEIRRKIEEAMKEAEQQIDEAVSNAQVAAQCGADVAALEARSKKIVESVKSCTSEASSELQSSYDATVAEFGEFKSELSEVQAEYEKCLTNENGFARSFTCAQQIAGELGGEVRDQFNSLATTLASYAQNYLRYQQKLEDCARTAGLDAFLEEVKDLSDKTKECIAAADKE